MSNRRLWTPDADAVVDAVKPDDAVKPKPQKSQEKPRKTPPGPTPGGNATPRYSPTIREMPQSERPRERMEAAGVGALTTAELIAILIRVGSGERSAVSLGEHLLAHFGSIQGLAIAPLEEMARVKGIGAVKAGQIKAAIEFGKRLSLFTEAAKPAIGGPRDVSNLLMPELRYLKKETLKSILLDTKNKVIGVKTVSIGDLSSSIVHPREVFKDAVVASAASVIVAHNHPSGDPTPSADVHVTKRAKSLLSRQGM